MNQQEKECVKPVNNILPANAVDELRDTGRISDDFILQAEGETGQLVYAFVTGPRDDFLVLVRMDALIPRQVKAIERVAKKYGGKLTPFDEVYPGIYGAGIALRSSRRDVVDACMVDLPLAGIERTGSVRGRWVKSCLSELQGRTDWVICVAPDIIDVQP